MLLWAGRYLLIATGAGLALSILFSLFLFVFSHLPLEMMMTPLILGIIPVGLLFAFFGPGIFVICFLYSYFIRYELNDIGITQHFGLIQHETCWLEMNGAEKNTLAKLQLYTISVLKRNRPLIIYADFLAQPQEFIDMVRRVAPTGNPMRQLLDNENSDKTQDLEEPPQDYSALHEQI